MCDSRVVSHSKHIPLEVLRFRKKSACSLNGSCSLIDIWEKPNLWKFKSLDVIYECSLKCKSCLQQTRCGWCSLDSDGMGACLEGTLQGPSHVTHCDMANYTHSGMYFLYFSYTIYCTYFCCSFLFTVFVLLQYSLCTYRVLLGEIISF